jgi:hypothetical protein
VEINFTHPCFITVVAKLDFIGGIPGFLSKKHIGQDERLCIHDVHVSSHGDDKVAFHQKSWKMLGGKRLV